MKILIAMLALVLSASTYAGHHEEGEGKKMKKKGPELTQEQKTKMKECRKQAKGEGLEKKAMRKAIRECMGDLAPKRKKG